MLLVSVVPCCDVQKRLLQKSLQNTLRNRVKRSCRGRPAVKRAPWSTRTACTYSSTPELALLDEQCLQTCNLADVHRLLPALRRYVFDLRLRNAVTQESSSLCRMIRPCSLSIDTPSGVNGASRRSSFFEIQIETHPPPRGHSMSAYRMRASI